MVYRPTQEEPVVNAPFVSFQQHTSRLFARQLPKQWRICPGDAQRFFEINL